MNTSNYGYPPPSYSVPYSSTPSSVGPHRPRFGFSGPAPYPRPRSSASKPNPASFSDSMINNYGDSSYNSDSAYTFNNSYQSDSSIYYSANETLYSNQSVKDSPMPNRRNDMGLFRDNALYGERSGVDNYPVIPKPALLQSKYPQSGISHGINRNGGFQKTVSSSPFKSKKWSFSASKFGKAKKAGMTTKGSWKCELCGIDFTSQIPYDMHLRGAKHAKKVKAQQITSSIQSQGIITSGSDNAFFCTLCNVTANSSLQFQTHLDGSKHKNKSNPKEPKEQSKDHAKKDGSEKQPGADATSETSPANVAAQTNPAEPTNVVAPASIKTNGSVSRPLPAEFGFSQPSKLAKFSCDICNIIVNSDVQLQQHLGSKRHQYKVEGKPLSKGRKNKGENKSKNCDTADPSSSEPSAVVSESSTVVSESTGLVLGVKTLESSFVHGETLQ